MWRLDGRSVPVWVGEVGTAPGDVPPSWRVVWGYVTDHGLDFAYWAVRCARRERESERE